MSITNNLKSAILSEGGLLPRDILAKLTARKSDLPGTEPSSYHIGDDTFAERIAEDWNKLLRSWERSAPVRNEREPNLRQVEHKWIMPLFERLGYGATLTPATEEFRTHSGRIFDLSHMHTGAQPIHISPYSNSLDERTASIRRDDPNAPVRPVSAHALLQEYLNSSDEAQWGVVTNGKQLRILRDSSSFTRLSFVEFDIERIFETRSYSEFAVFWMTCHATRFEPKGDKGCWLEQWNSMARHQGVRVLDKMHEGFRVAIETLVLGILEGKAPANIKICQNIQDGALNPQDLYRETLRIIYRLVFIFTVEDRGLLFAPDASLAAKKIYEQGYATKRLRNLARTLAGTPHSDLWAGITIVFGGLTTGQPALGLPALGGWLFSKESVQNIEGCIVSNRRLLEAIRALSFFVDESGAKRPVDWGHLGSEEIGSVYQSLLALKLEVGFEPARASLGSHSSGGERATTGSHYTPSSILNKVLDFALEPAMEQALEGKKNAAEKEQALLALSILDPSCGSGHFLVAAAHRVARKIAQIRTGDEEPSAADTRHALRDVVSHCLYGVDVNPMAVELCRFALWLETIEPGKPLSFLDHRIRLGDSLLGVPLNATVRRLKNEVFSKKAELEKKLSEVASNLSRSDLTDDAHKAQEKKLSELKKEIKNNRYQLWPDAIPNDAFKASPKFADPSARGLSYEPDNKDVAKKAQQNNDSYLKNIEKSGGGSLFDVAVQHHMELATLVKVIANGNENSLADIAQKEKLFRAFQESSGYHQMHAAADTWLSAFFWRHDGKHQAPTSKDVWDLLQGNLVDSNIDGPVSHLAAEYHFFHYEIEFPEVFSRGGFDVVIGNPPYLGGKKISTNMSDNYLAFLKSWNLESGSTTDLCAYFVRRYFDALKKNGNLGFVTTNTVAQGDTREASLDPIVNTQTGTIPNAIRSMKWEGQANLEVALIHLHKGPWSKTCTLDGKLISSISPLLEDGSQVSGEPFRLAENADKSFIGSYVLGMGFVLEPKEAQELLAKDTGIPERKYSDVIFPYLNGEDLNSRPNQSPSRFVINFFDWPLRREDPAIWEKLDAMEREDAKKRGIVEPDYPKQVAADYPDCLDRIERMVKPERDVQKRDALRERWWHYADKRPGLYRAISGLEQCAVVSQVSSVWCVGLVPTGQILSNMLIVFAGASTTVFGIIQSAFHDIWGLRYGSTMRTDRRYAPTNGFETFPFPYVDSSKQKPLKDIGQRYHNHRRTLCLARNIGLTKTYNLFNDPATDSDSTAVQKAQPPFEDIRALRALHKELDEAVLAAYGWTDINLAHNFYRGKDAGSNLKDDAVRYTISPEARREILGRLLKLNNHRHAEEEKLKNEGKPVTSAFDWLE